LSKELAANLKQFKDGSKETGSVLENSPDHFMRSIGKTSIVDSDVDGLIKWAKDLPDDISVSAGLSFYQSIGKIPAKAPAANPSN